VSFIKSHRNPGDTQYVPRNPEKYVGREKVIICRSSWEEQFCRWCDLNANVIEWASEAIQIPYIDPITKKPRRYFPDFYMKVRDQRGAETQYVVEVKPYAETLPPKQGRNKAQFLARHKTWLTNQAKWLSAQRMCRRLGFEFKIVTEKQLFGK
jgi:hypothetical protein